MTTVELSVIICAHNPRPAALIRVMDSLRRQTLPSERWELLLVDNQSTSVLAQSWDLSWHPQGRHVREETLGLTPARLRGIEEARGDILVFVDDDNVLSDDYLEHALRIGLDWPILGTWGGSIEGEFEVPPPPDLVPYLGFLAVRPITSPRWANVRSCAMAEPWGAGLCLRRNVAEDYASYCRSSGTSQLDRRGKDLLSGGDVEISMLGCRTGYGMGVFPQLRLVHLIPRERLTRDYFVRIAEGIATSSEVLRRRWHEGAAPHRLSPYQGLQALRHLLTPRRTASRMFFAHWRGQRRGARIIRDDEEARTSEIPERPTSQSALPVAGA